MVLSTRTRRGFLTGRSSEDPATIFPPEATPAGAAGGFAHYASIGDGCLAHNYVDCQACRDSCPAGAIRFRPRLGGPFVPELDAQACTGCGACIAVCPADSITMKPRHPEAAHV
ncbi:4Fe-4S dicluster domain-containing protein [Rhizobium leguminosarum]|uniref:4Fe-4S dicluster domain-containing protein n=1 Tax=Rhizobium leguminosarum TaxID=384 RepID=UPI001AE534E1|nr:4Fe-4S dicluster domain-containing protein [Rhizobium leguminosarum]MBP2445119.1 ferredoxin [Rhizobium leguminosarum]